MLDARTAQTTLELLLRDTIRYGLGRRLPAVASVAALRAIKSLGASATPMRDNDDLICISGPPVQAFEWSQSSTSADDGVNVIKPNDAGATGRWIAWTSPIRFAQTVGADATTLDQFTSGPLARVIAVDKNFGDDELMNLIGGQVPAVIVQSDDDDPSDATQDAGFLYNNIYSFTIHVVTENLRDRRQAAQGSDVPGDTDPGANSIDGLLQALLLGAQLYPAIPNVTNAIKVVRKGRGYNWISDLNQGRVIRSRKYFVYVSEEIPPYTSDAGPLTDVGAQAELVEQNDAPAYDPNNYLASGCQPTVGGALAQSISAGSAVIAGATVNYAGQAFTFPANSDTYRDLAPNGTLTLTSVNVNGEPPPLAAGSLRIGVTTTSIAVVLSDEILAETQAPFGPQFDFPV